MANITSYRPLADTWLVILYLQTVDTDIHVLLGYKDLQDRK